ncbi:CubicO group peptidase (beta-lactamase class C family) [Silvibacterium bohemicum]|uniref:CubicO group peptidase (Beta-lactamase class C family) n=1 Tax=Silvibacterium bohemicum TaxID=1577686 RepID=A0A841K1S0_9BACT|nr:serine hydrolase domain-containing protein [Silvibacterium bohemicum]MBB6147350.1 CubicO group peptidase (beta-lactamase class C family) [Silvibacterium bohemicum]
MPSATSFIAFIALVSAYSITLAGQTMEANLDTAANRVILQERVVGASVLVVQRDKIILHKGYGFADLALEAPTQADSFYHVVGPIAPFEGVAIMQQVERGKLSLDDDISRLIPEFPLQGHHITVRELLNHTSGIVDYHYLGDQFESTYQVPKSEDEMMALFSGRPWVAPPGIKWDWSISNFQLLDMLIERVTGQTYDEYMQQNLFVPSGATTIIPCNNSTLVHGLSHGYHLSANGYTPATEDSAAAGYDLRYCSNVTDIYRVWHAVRQGKLLRPETLRLMSTADPSGLHISGHDPDVNYGLALVLNHEDSHRSIGQNGSLLGYSGSLYEFPAEDLTVVVLSNTAGQNAADIGMAVARKALGLPDVALQTNQISHNFLSDEPTTVTERSQFTGTYRLKVINGAYHESFSQYRQTYRVFQENGRLMIEALNEMPERLLKQKDGSFALASDPNAPITFVLSEHQPITINLTRYPGLKLSGERIGPGDIQTFHHM